MSHKYRTHLIVLLDEKGHAHLTDFNIAVHFKPEKALTAVAGSMAYMGMYDLSQAVWRRTE